MPGQDFTGTQRQSKAYLVFDNFESMDTQPNRMGMDKKKLAWCENLQPIGPNDLQTVSGPAAAALLTLPGGDSASLLFYANYNSTDYIIVFCASGAAYQIVVSSGASTTIAAAGTFSTAPDCTIWASARVLIADATAGYCTWDGSVFVKKGAVSPSFTVTAGGSGYNSGATAAITGGTGSGATASVQVTGGVVVGLTLTAAGTGYAAGDTLTVTISPVSGGSGATATGKVWPQFALTPTTVAVYQGRVWLAGTRTLTWTGTGGYDDAASANASGSTVLADSDLIHNITGLRALNNYLYIFGDNSIKQIGTISVSGSSTIFTVVTLSSDQGTTFPQTILSYNRLILFANKTGVFAIFGASVEKISPQMDGVFQNIQFSQNLVAALNDINNIHCYLVLAKYFDSTTNANRSIFMVFMNKKWFVVSQNGAETCCTSVPINGVINTYASSGTDVTQILSSSTTAVAIKLQTALNADQKVYIGKRVLRYLVTQSSLGSSPSFTMQVFVDTENGSIEQDYTVSVQFVWQNNALSTVTWQNNVATTVVWAGVGNVIQREPGSGSGIYLGMTVKGTFSKFSICNLVLEYQEATAMASLGAN